MAAEIAIEQISKRVGDRFKARPKEGEEGR
jgi:hypothetical protein